MIQIRKSVCLTANLYLHFINSKILTQDADKVRAFNTYFHSVFTAPTDIEIFLLTDDVRHNIKSNNIDFSPNSPNLVYETMPKASLSLASGPDAIPSYFWNRLASALSLSISIDFTASYHFFILP